MKIESKRLDEKVPLIEPSAREIAAFILQGRPEMLEVFSDVLVGCSKYTGNTFVNEKIVKSIERYKYLYPEIAQDIELILYPKPDRGGFQDWQKGWHKAVKYAYGWAKEL